MILKYLGYHTNETKLAQLLGTRPFGTPAPNVSRLEQLGFSVTYESTTLATLENNLAAGIPCLIFVRTGNLPYWDEDTAHVLVAVGFEDESLYVNDPAFDVAPQSIPLDYFLLAWSEFDHRMAIIQRMM